MVVVAAGAQKLQSKKQTPIKKQSAGKPNPSIKKKKSKPKNNRKGRRILHVVHAGEGPKQKNLGNGKVRNYDICPSQKDEQYVSRRTRDFMSQMAKMKAKGNENDANRDKDIFSLEQNEVQTKRPRNGNTFKQSDQGNNANNLKKQGKLVKADKDPKSKKDDPFSGMKPGESLASFKARLRSESKQLMMDVAKKHSRKQEKRKAYYEKRKQKLKRRKTDAFDDESDEENAEDDDYEEEQENISRFPAYWQEILRNNGRPISKKRKARMRRQEEEEDKVRFGEQAERPPQFDSLPVARGRSQVPN